MLQIDHLAQFDRTSEIVLNTNVVTDNGTTGRFRFLTIGSICFLFVTLQTKSGFASGNKILTIPSDCKPSQAVYNNCMNSSGATGRLAISATNTDEVTCSNLSGQDWIFGTLMWVIGK